MLDNSLTVSDKIRVLRDHFNLSQRAFAEVLGVAGGTVAAYEARSRKAAPGEDKLRVWAERFGFPYSWFLDGKIEAPDISRDYKEAESLARLRRNALAHSQNPDLSTETEDPNLMAVHPDELTYEEDDFALGGQMVDVPLWQGVLAHLNETHFIEEERPRTVKVPPFFFSRKKLDRFIVGIPQGDSMAPRIVTPDRLVVLLASDAQPNSIVVARRSDGVNFVKVLRIDHMGRKELHSINPKYPPITDLTGWVMKGVVVGIWKPWVDNGTNIEFNGGMPLRA